MLCFLLDMQNYDHLVLYRLYDIFVVHLWHARFMINGLMYSLYDIFLVCFPNQLTKCLSYEAYSCHPLALHVLVIMKLRLLTIFLLLILCHYLFKYIFSVVICLLLFPFDYLKHSVLGAYHPRWLWWKGCHRLLGYNWWTRAQQSTIWHIRENLWLYCRGNNNKLHLLQVSVRLHSSLSCWWPWGIYGIIKFFISWMGLIVV